MSYRLKTDLEIECWGMKFTAQMWHAPKVISYIIIIKFKIWYRIRFEDALPLWFKRIDKYFEIDSNEANNQTSKQNNNNNNKTVKPTRSLLTVHE